MLHSRGELLLMLDADGATKVNDLEKLENQVIFILIFKLLIFYWTVILKVLPWAHKTSNISY